MVIQKNIDETADHSGKLGSLVTLEYRVIVTSILLSSPLLLEAIQEAAITLCSGVTTLFLSGL